MYDFLFKFGILKNLTTFAAVFLTKKINFMKKICAFSVFAQKKLQNARLAVCCGEICPTLFDMSKCLADAKCAVDGGRNIETGIMAVESPGCLWFVDFIATLRP